ncbi:hypothetical protein THRCLA_22764, partial [Thraustotheca clavata]
MHFRYIALVFAATVGTAASEHHHHHHHHHHRHHDSEEACTNVSVQGDATYCIEGPICSGTSGSGKCPKKGDAAVADCLANLKSYV